MGITELGRNSTRVQMTLSPEPLEGSMGNGCIFIVNISGCYPGDGYRPYPFDTHFYRVDQQDFFL